MKNLIDNYNRKITYLRVSITDRCNLSCIYCKSRDKSSHLIKEEILTFEEIIRILKLGVKLGIRKIRITGGEPLLRNNLTGLIKEISKIEGMEELALTTNGVFLSKFAEKLKISGIQRLNISLDTLDEDKFRRLTGGNLKDVIKGIDEVRGVGFKNIKINFVVLRGVNDDEIYNFIDFAKKKDLTVRFIEYMPLNLSSDWKERFISRDEILERIKDKIIDSPLPRKIPEVLRGLQKDGEIAKYYLLRDEKIRIGLISPVTHGFCSECNRFRLTCDGKLLVCLANNIKIDLKKAIRSGRDDAEIGKLFHQACRLKPESGIFFNRKIEMQKIGG